MFSAYENRKGDYVSWYMLTNIIVVIILWYIPVSSQHIVALNLYNVLCLLYVREGCEGKKRKDAPRNQRSV